jgi:hypothetical protein
MGDPQMTNTHPADCQSCVEGTEPCSMHATDWRYGHAVALDAFESCRQWGSACAVLRLSGTRCMRR